MFEGYLIKKPGTDLLFPAKYITFGSYKTVPRQRQDKDSYRDYTGLLHRSVVTSQPSGIQFATRDGLDLAAKMEIQNFFEECLVNRNERKYYIEFWDDERNEYRQENMYMPDQTFEILYYTEDNIFYASLEFELIGYGN